jgi:hypothetical protein
VLACRWATGVMLCLLWACCLLRPCGSLWGREHDSPGNFLQFLIPSGPSSVLPAANPWATFILRVSAHMGSGVTRATKHSRIVTSCAPATSSIDRGNMFVCLVTDSYVWAVHKESRSPPHSSSIMFIASASIEKGQIEARGHDHAATTHCRHQYCASPRDEG